MIPDKICVLQIANCEDCPHFNKFDWKCKLKDLRIDDGDDQPKWCPLPDAPQNGERQKPSHNSAMLKCRLWNKGRGCPIGKVPCPEGHGCMLQIGTSA